jgi:hypothetical protein
LKKAMRKIALPYAAPLMAITILAMTLTQAMTCMSGVVPHKTEGRIQLYSWVRLWIASSCSEYRNNLDSGPASSARARLELDWACSALRV